MSEKPQAQPQSESPEEIPNNSFMPGKKFNLPDGTVIEVAYDNGDRTFGVTETDRDGKLRLLSMSEGDLRGLNDSLLMTDEEVSENYQRNMAEGADEDTKPSGGFDVDAEVAQAQSRLEEAPIAVADISEIAEPEPTGEGGPQESSVESGEFEVATPEEASPAAALELKSARTLDQVQAELAAARSKRGNLMDRDTDRGRELRDKIQALMNEEDVLKKQENKGAPSSSTEKPRSSTLDYLDDMVANKQAEFDALSDADKAGDEGKALQNDIAVLKEQKKAVEAILDGKTEEKSGDTALRSSTLDYLDDMVANKQAEFDALSDADKAGDEGKALQNDIAVLKEQKKAVEAILDGKTEEKSGDTALEEKDQKAEKAKALRDQFENNRKEVMEKYKEDYDAKIRELSEVNAKLATKFWGRRKNRERAQQLEAEIAGINKNISRDFLKASKESGRYDLEIDSPKELEQAVWQMKADDLVELAVSADRELFNETTARLVERQENRNKFQRFLANAGQKWINKGKGVPNALAGFGTGFATSSIATAFGATMPVSAAILTVVGGAGTAATYAGSREASIADMVDARKSEGYKLDERMFDGLKATIGAETERMIAEAVKGKGKYVAAASGDLSGALMRGQRERSIDRNNKITLGAGLRALTFAGAFVGGAKAGAMTAEMAKDLFASPDAGAISGKELPVADFDRGRYPDLGGFEFPSDAGRITRGEGWFSQFADMGMTPEQARAMFNDSSVMERLVDSGAAYVDNSARIGGYGINLPSNGYLSDAAMNIIKEAATAKGF